MKTALITGASSGIGLELAHIFAAHKTNLVLVARNQTQLQLLAQELQQKYNVQVMVCVKDLSKTNQVNELVTELNNLAILGLLMKQLGKKTKTKLLLILQHLPI